LPPALPPRYPVPVAKAKAKAKARKAVCTPMDGRSLVIVDHRRNQLQALFPDVFTEGKLDWERLRAALGGDIETANERYHLTWAGKSGAIRALQSPTTATLAPCREESVNFDGTDNLFIEGENLEVLKVLQKAYFGKIKMIYIDPPYNTGNDHFIYPDRFAESKKDYLKRVGDMDEEGQMMVEGLFRKNSLENGHYHSNWLSMIYPRLFLARNLLREDGVIFVSIDDNEAHNLRLVMNEIFGEENFVANLIWKSRQNKDNRNVTGASIDHEYVLCYSKANEYKALKGSPRKTEQYSNPDNDPRGPWASGNMVGILSEDLRPNCHYDLINPDDGINYGKPKMGWRYDKNTMAKLIKEKRILWPPTKNGRPRKKTFLNELSDKFAGYSSVMGTNVYTRNGTQEIEALFGQRVFDFPKPSLILRELIKQAAGEDGVVLDFFAGSCPTAHAVLDLNAEDGGNRKFICVQMTEACDEKSEAHKAGYATIADIGKERIRRVIDKISKEHGKQPNLAQSAPSPQGDYGFKVFKLCKSNFRIWRARGIKTEAALARQLHFQFAGEMCLGLYAPGAPDSVVGFSQLQDL